MLYDCFCKTSKQLKKIERKGIVGLFVSMSNVASEQFLMVCDSLSQLKLFSWWSQILYLVAFAFLSFSIKEITPSSSHYFCEKGRFLFKAQPNYSDSLTGTETEDHTWAKGL